MSNLNQANLEALRQRLSAHPSHLSTILDGAVASFKATSNPLRFTNTANALRELLRELFDSISPDAKIVRCSWFTADTSSRTGVTRRHRTQFAVYSGLDPEHFPTNFVSNIDGLADQIGNRVSELSAFTHVTVAVLAVPEERAIAAFDSTIDLFLRLFAAIDSAREHLRDALQVELQERLSDIFTSEFFDELDILSTHTRPQEAEDVDVEIDDIGEETITFTGTGSVLCDLQYGSDGDCDRGDGVETSGSYPFTFSGEAQTTNPRNVTVEKDDVIVDTTSFYE
jgi:hypothetical protein